MRFTRHSLIPAAVMLASAVLSITPATAATKVNIPFNFVASGKTFPAGTYSVDQGDMSNTVRLVGPKVAISWIGLPSDPDPSGKSAVLKFDQIGQTYMLRTLQYGRQTTPRLDSKAREIEAAQERTIVGGQ